MIVSALLLALALGAYVYFFKGDFGRLHELAAFQPPGWRRKRYRIWIAKSWALFAAPAVLGLLIDGRIGAVVVLPREFLGLAHIAGYPAPPWGMAEEILIGLAGGTVLGGGWALFRRRKRKRPAMLGDFSALLPQDRGEALLAAGSAISAGITEELYFRLLVPLLVAQLTGSAALGFGIATLLFGLAHRYQKWIGVVTTALIGALLAFVYLESGALWVAMLVHALIDVNGLVLRPALGGMLKRPPAS